MIYDCAVVGAGPAGSAAALYLSRAGLTAALLDRASFPRRKACGEGILPAGVAVLRELGVFEEAAALGRTLDGVSYTTRGGWEARCRFPDGAGLAARREDLDHLLLRRAAAAPGVSVLEGREVRAVERSRDGVVVRFAGGALSARRLIAADGGASPCLGSLGVPRRAPAPARFGLSARLRGVAGVGGFVEVYLLGGGELYLTPLPGEGRVSAALLLERASLAGAPGREDAFWRLARSHAALAPRLSGAELEAPVIGLGPLAAEPARCEDGPWLAAGDAAGAVDPLVGDGVGLALRGGRLAAAETAAALAGAGERGRYTGRRRRMLRPKRRLASFALLMSRRPALARAAIAVLRAFPAAFRALLSD